MLKKNGKYLKLYKVNFDILQKKYQATGFIFESIEDKDKYEAGEVVKCHAAIFNTSSEIIKQFARNASSVKTIQDNVLTAIYRAMQAELPEWEAA